MYVPKRFKVTDTKEIWEFVKQHSFATLVTAEDNIPVATHLPVTVSRADDDYRITGHMAYANLQWKTFESVDDALVIFQGPHAYVSSTWYAHENVPTWNYPGCPYVWNAAYIGKRRTFGIIKNVIGYV